MQFYIQNNNIDSDVSLNESRSNDNVYSFSEPNHEYYQDIISATVQNISQATLPPMQNEHDFTFVRKFGKLAFKYSLASQHSTTKHIDFNPELFDLFYLERPSLAVIEYARVVFSNRSRVLDYLEVNFCKFSFT